MTDVETRKKVQLFCRNGSFGVVTPPLTDSIQVEITCPYSGCKRGGAKPTHIWVVAADVSKDICRPVRSVFRDLADPRAVLDSVKTERG